MRHPIALAVLFGLGLAGCAGRHGAAPGLTPRTQGPAAHGAEVVDPHVPLFASAGWEPFTRRAAIAVALREWRLFGRPVDDDRPDSRPPPLPEDKPERMDGLWQRVGEYWWIGQDPGEREVAWTGMHDETGTMFTADEDGQYAWSAAFISYVMRIAGAGDRFPYSPNHSTYINAAVTGASAVLRAHPPAAYAPVAGDLICTGRGGSAGIGFAQLPTAGMFPSHCDIVVVAQPGWLTVIGGNVDDAVTVKHVPVSASGLLVGSAGTVLDTRYPWFVVLEVVYDR